jgi:hypothetical protein
MVYMGLITPHRKENSLLRNVTQGLGLGRILLVGRPRRTWETHITSKIYLREIGWGGMD